MTNTAAAALTERVQVITNIVVLPLHRPALLAKQLATLDVLADGRLQVGVGVGGREQDYRSLDVPFEGRHRRLDATVAELRRLWDGGARVRGRPARRARPHTPGGPPLLAAAMGPKSMARAARWAAGVTGFSIGADPAEIARGNSMALDAWEAAGRTERPRLVSGSFYLLGGPGRRRRAEAVRPGLPRRLRRRRRGRTLPDRGAEQPRPAARRPGRGRGGRVRRVHPGAGHGRPVVPGADHRGTGRLTATVPRAGRRLRSRSPRPSRSRTRRAGSRAPGHGPRSPARARRPGAAVPPG